MAAYGLDNPVIAAFAFHCCLLVLKMAATGILTAFVRASKKVYVNEEDCNMFATPVKSKTDDPDVERVRRIHQNDIENILPYVLVGIFYCLSGPATAVAVWHFRLYTASRLLHTFSYKYALPQPSRLLCHLAGIGITVSMAVQVFSVTSW